jgi:ABC-type glycerol-3-phosphate transport system substrate-binding protein
VPVPQLPGADLAWASFWVEGVAKKSQQKQQVWEFLQFLSSSQTMQKLYQAQSQVRLFGEPYSRVDMASSLTNNALAAPFVNQASKAKTWYLCSRTFDNGLNDRMIKYFEDAVNAVNDGKSAKETLATTEQGVAQLLSQYGLGSYTVR